MARCVFPAFALVLCLLPSQAAAQGGRIDESPLYNRLATGAGARAWGMGGAQIAVPGEGEAITWNPATIGTLGRPHVSFSFSGDRLAGDLAPTTYRSPSGQRVGLVDIGSITPTLSHASGHAVDFVAVVFPFNVGRRRVVAGLAYDTHLSFSQQADSAYQFRHDSMYTFNYDYAYSAAGTGGFDTVTFSIASELARGLIVGANIHRWFNGPSVPATESYNYSVVNVYSWTGTYNEVFTDRVNLDISAFSIDLGGLILLGNRFSAGVIYRGGFGADVSYSNAPSYRNDHTGDSFSSSLSGASVLRIPSTIGAGVAARLGSRLTVAIDHVQTRWSRAQIDAYARTTAQGAAPAPTAYAFPTMKPVGTVQQSDAGRSAVGAEYSLRLKSWSVPVRAGVFYQQTYVNDGSPGAWGVAAGAGIRRGHMVVDAAWVRDRASGRYARNAVRTSLGYTFGDERRQP